MLPKPSRFLTPLLISTAALAWALPASAQMRHSAMLRPNVEINLQALRELRAGVADVQLAAPVNAAPQPSPLVWQEGLPGQVVDLPPEPPKPLAVAPPTPKPAPAKPAPVVASVAPPEPMPIPAPVQVAPPKPVTLSDVPPPAEPAEPQRAEPQLLGQMSDPVPLEMPQEMPRQMADASPPSAPPAKALPPKALREIPPPAQPAAPKPEAKAKPQPIIETVKPAQVVEKPAAAEKTTSAWYDPRGWFGGVATAPGRQPVATPASQPVTAATQAETVPAQPAPAPKPAAALTTPPPAEPAMPAPPVDALPPAAPPAIAKTLAPQPPPPQQIAALPAAPNAGAVQNTELKVLFSAEETAIPEGFKGELAQLSNQLKADPNLRVSLVSHASAKGDQVSTARRISLARALAVRAYLIDQGVDNLRINRAGRRQ